MSKVSTFVQAVDDKYYQNPIIFGEDAYVCFDDEDDPEIIIKHEKGRSKQESAQIANERMEAFGIKGRILRSTYGRASGRLFPPDWQFHEAVYFDFDIDQPIPIPTQYDCVVDYPSMECRFYSWTMEFDTETIVNFLTDEGHDKYLMGFMLGKPHYMVQPGKALKIVKKELLRQFPQLRNLGLTAAITLVTEKIKVRKR